MAVYRSVVKWFDNKKGYGFLVHPEGGTDIFVHYSAIGSDKRFKTLKTGQVVLFDLNDGPKGLHAQNVMLEEETDVVPGQAQEHQQAASRPAGLNAPLLPASAASSQPAGYYSAR